jgi:DNA modification methylase
MNRLILGDNLEIMRKMDSESVDLIYLDPPFFSNRNYEVIWGDKGEIRSFQDRWSGGIDHYIAWLKERVIEMHRILKSTGSIFLHCDWHASHYIKTQILDKLFRYDNFRGEIIWLRANAHNDARKKLSVLTDSIFYYTKSEDYTYNPVYVPLSEKYTEKSYRLENEKGKYRLVVLTAPGVNPNDKEWRNYHPKNIGRHWSVPKEIVSRLVGEKANEMSIIERLDLLYENDFIEFSKSGIPNYKRYLELSNEKGLILGNIWTDIKNLQGIDRERIGYPTQKPEKLLERVIKASSNENDVVFDPFVGGGTTVVVAEKLNRRWIGIDQSVQAVKVTEYRLTNDRNLFANPFIVQLHKYDYDTLFTKNAFEFETWIIDQFGGIGNTKQKSDFGIDGKTRENIPIQVKQSENIGRNVVDNFGSAIKRSDKALYEKNRQESKIAGYIIAFSFGKGAIQEVARLQNDENVLIKLVRVDEIVPISVKPTVNVTINDNGETEKHLREIEFIAKGETTEGKHIEFYAWDFNYNEKQFCAETLRDRNGKQTKIFKAGEYKIAVKVIDNEGLENTEIIKLKINGKIEIN